MSDYPNDIEDFFAFIGEGRKLAPDMIKLQAFLTNAPVSPGAAVAIYANVLATGPVQMWALTITWAYAAIRFGWPIEMVLAPFKVRETYTDPEYWEAQYWAQVRIWQLAHTRSGEFLDNDEGNAL